MPCGFGGCLYMLRKNKRGSFWSHSLLHVDRQNKKKKRTEAYARVRLPVLDEGVVMRGEERAALELLHQKLHHGVRDGGAVEGGGAWSDGGGCGIG